MATESFGRIVHMDDEFADRFIAMDERVRAKPPRPNTHEIRWGDPKKIAEAWKKERIHAE